MIYSKLHSKDTKEDPKTSSIIGSLILLPDKVFYDIIIRACTPSGMPSNNGMITGVEFWPHWNDDTYNSRFVEPDVIVYCEYRDILIEAKYGETRGQYFEQWQKEINAYQEVYGRGKNISFIALGGNDDYAAEDVDGVTIMKCSWSSLLMAVLSTRSQLELISFVDEHISQTIRILKHIETSFEVHGVYSVKPLDVRSLTKYTVNASNKNI